MNPSVQDSSHPFDPILDSDEKLFWVGRPNHLIFMLTGVPLLILGCIWGAIDVFGFIVPMMKSSSKGPPLGFILPFFLLHLLPFWASILNIARLYLVRNNTWYGFTNKRILLRTGFWGTGFKTLDYDRISDIAVSVGPVENRLGLGTIRALSGDAANNHSLINNSFIGIEKPYDVFKNLKEVSINVKTDWNYPNALRPAENPGYHTEYAAGQADESVVRK